MKKWAITSKVKRAKSKIEEIAKILLANRGIKTKKETEEFLNPPNPYALTANRLGIDSQEVAKAVKRIKKAIKSGEKIIVYGDYDTDGVCATAIMWETLHKLGAKVMPFIPTRTEGYGLKAEKIEELQREGISLIVTVDHGIVANNQVKRAKELGVDVIICDHHLPEKKKPEALALVHTTRLAGAGVSWFLASRLGNPGLELVTIGTIADVMPLLGPNRSIVKYGLESLHETKIPGLVALFQAAGIAREKIGTYEIGFIIGPRLNAAGRMEDPMEALRLICTKDKERAVSLATKIDEQNRQRQFLTEQATLHARGLWLTEDGKRKMIFVSHESYEEGIVGLVAGKLMEEFYRPAIVVSKGEKYSRASARSTPGFNIIEAIRACADILGPHGGHPMAAGFTVETVKLEELKMRLVKIAEREINKEKLTPVLKIDMRLDCRQLTLELCEKLTELAPFGVGNPEPVFLTRGFLVADAQLVGANSSHLKLHLTCPSLGIIFEAIGFGKGNLFSSLSPEAKIDLVYNLSLDTWNGNRRIQLKIKDLKVSDGKRA